MGRASPAVTPAEARLGSFAMACLAILAVLVGGAFYRSTGAVGLPALFLLLGIIGAWQAGQYRRMEKP